MCPHSSHWLMLIALLSNRLATTVAFTSRTSFASKHQFPPLSDASSSNENGANQSASLDDLFENFVTFLLDQQKSIIAEIESSIELDSGATFGCDAWGVFANPEGDLKQTSATSKSGGITRVIQGGIAIEKGACSLTLIRDGTLTAERAATIRGRQATVGGNDNDSVATIAEGDLYSAAALSMVLHSRNPLVPTFRSDVRVFLVTDKSSGTSSAWFGGGADLTPYYIFPDDIQFFHQMYHDLCAVHRLPEPFSYETMKIACDDYFYLPARQEHRGTGGIFFDDLPMTAATMAFTQAVTETWMPSWLPIVAKRNTSAYTAQQKQWQKLRRGRYLEFNLLYDRGVKFGLQTMNPRVEGVMVSAPPEIAYEYNHQVEPNSPEAKLVDILRKPRPWV